MAERETATRERRSTAARIRAFEPGLGLQLSNPVADSPTGCGWNSSTPDEARRDELADAQIKDATIELPDGLTVSPGGAAGLPACSDAQLGLGAPAAVHCPSGVEGRPVEIVLAGPARPLTGTIYLGEERPGERFRLFIAAPGGAW